MRTVSLSTSSEHKFVRRGNMCGLRKLAQGSDIVVVFVKRDALREACKQSKRWMFILSAVALAVRGGTGLPLNPIAI